LRRFYVPWWLVVGRPALVLAVPVLLSACAVSSISSPFKSGSADENASSVNADRLLENAKADNGQEAAASGAAAHCPQVVAWPHDRLLTVYEPGHNGDSLSIVHRGEITKLARECQLYSDRVVVKYGFAGRVLLGPKGQAGVVNLPIRVHVSGADKKVLANDAVKLTATIPAGNPVGYFSMVKEISFPVVVGSRPEDYKIFVAFDKPAGGQG
jgi:hypothetical protein